ncbi:MAG: hypothetical protein RDU30_05810 [Desulfovibrionaceae bacterium]|nr:hypothetical protein [Desulfovibrionaceae bacterium]
MTLPIVAALGIVLGWYLVFNYEGALRAGTSAAFCRTQLEMARSLARNAEQLIESRHGVDAPPVIESEIRQRILDPVSLLGGGAWMFAPGRSDCQGDPGLPWCGGLSDASSAGDGNDLASGMERLLAEASTGREGAGRFVFKGGNRQEIIAWAPVRAGGMFVVVGVTASFTDLLAVTGVVRQSRSAMVMMGLMTLGGLGLVILSAGNIVRRRRAEIELARANADLEVRVASRTEELAAKTKALMESRLRERLSEKEAEIAFQAGLVQSAGAYLHTTGNALTSLEGLFLKMRRTLEAAARTGEAFAAARQAAETALGRPDGPVVDDIAALETALLGRAVPRLEAILAEMGEVKARMIAELEGRRTLFDARKNRGRLHQAVDLGRLLADAVEQARPECAARGLSLVAKDSPGLVVQAARRTVSHGVSRCLAMVRDAARPGRPGEIACQAARGPDGRMLLVMRARGPAFVEADPSREDPELLAFINYLNENHGVFGIVRDSEGFCVEVELGDMPIQEWAGAQPAP